jgi:hypothetical protein
LTTRARRPAQLDGLIDDLGVAKYWMVHLGRHAEMAHLRIGEYLVHLVDRAAGHAGYVEDVDPFAARLAAGNLGDRGMGLFKSRSRPRSLFWNRLNGIGVD